MIRERAYTLVLAIVLTGALAVTLGVLGEQFTGTVRCVRSADLEVRAAQLLSDGQAWLTLHGRDPGAIPDSGAVELPVDDLNTSGITGSLIVRRVDGAHHLEIVARIRRGSGAAMLRMEVEAPVR